MSGVGANGTAWPVTVYLGLAGVGVSVSVVVVVGVVVAGSGSWEVGRGVSVGPGGVGSGSSAGTSDSAAVVLASVYEELLLSADAVVSSGGSVTSGTGITGTADPTQNCKNAGFSGSQSATHAAMTSGQLECGQMQAAHSANVGPVQARGVSAAWLQAFSAQRLVRREAARRRAVGAGAEGFMVFGGGGGGGMRAYMTAVVGGLNGCVGLEIH